MPSSRLRAVFAAFLAIAVLGGCGSSDSVGPSGAPSPDTSGVLDGVTVQGTDAAPSLVFETTPLSVPATTTKVLQPGSGPALTPDNSVVFNYSLFNAHNGAEIDTSYGKGTVPLDLSSSALMKGLSKGLLGQHVGSRLLIAIPPADGFGAQGNTQASVGPTDTIVFLVDVISASTPLTTATGVEVAPKPGLPTVSVGSDKVATVSVPATAPPTTLVVQPLIKGSGAVVKTGETIKVTYTGVLWANGEKFDASADHGAPVDFQIGTGKVIAGWDKGLVGQTVGSRILLIVPPADGYGDAGSPPVGPTDTMVFVIDILAAS
ncbi:MAG: FKBP-type peptidyl-prolyl cis-trans isomerase [Ornithinibacter sp.]